MEHVLQPQGYPAIVPLTFISGMAPVPALRSIVCIAQGVGEMATGARAVPTPPAPRLHR